MVVLRYLSGKYRFGLLFDPKNCDFGLDNIDLQMLSRTYSVSQSETDVNQEIKVRESLKEEFICL